MHECTTRPPHPAATPTAQALSRQKVAVSKSMATKVCMAPGAATPRQARAGRRPPAPVPRPSEPQRRWILQSPRGRLGKVRRRPHPPSRTSLRRCCRLLRSAAPGPRAAGTVRLCCGHGRIPRTRGDGPLSPPPWNRLDADSPHPRGWTLATGGGATAGAGFPAPAGMGWLELHSDPGVRPEQEPRAGAEEEPLSEGRVQNRRRLRPEPLEGVGRVSAAAPADAAMAAPPVPGGRALIRPDARRA